MPRTKTFDPGCALTKAMEVFRAHGYRNTHMRQVAEHTGVSRSSLYATFGDKRALFLKALRQDAERCRRDRMPDLQTAAAPRGAIIALFASAAAEGAAGPPPPISLLIRAALELVPDDPEASAAVQDELALLEDNFRHGIARATELGEVSRTVDAAATACILLSLFVGSQLLMRNTPMLHAAAGQVEALLPPPGRESGG